MGIVDVPRGMYGMYVACLHIPCSIAEPNQCARREVKHEESGVSTLSKTSAHLGLRNGGVADDEGLGVGAAGQRLQVDEPNPESQSKKDIETRKRHCCKTDLQ